MTDCVGLVWETDGAALADAVVAGVALAVVAGVVLAAVGGVVLFGLAAGVVLAVVAGLLLSAGLAVAFDFGVALAFDVTGGALGDAFALGAGDFVASILLGFSGFSFFGATVALVAGCSVEVVGAFVSGPRCLVGGAFLSGFVAAGDSFTTGSFTGGGATFFGVCGALGFSSAGAFLSGFLPGDSSGVGCWAITAPASTNEQTVINVVNFFMMFLVWS